MAPLRPLPRSFYDRNAAWVAPELVGCLLVRRAQGGRVRVARIVETEAYVGEFDLACHARVGRTARTEVMFGTPGRAYVYLVYGMHHCLNAVCGPGAAANAVLIRAAAPVPEDELPARAPVAPLLHSATGPGNLCKALSVSLAQNREDLCSAKSALFVARRPAGPPPRLWAGPRIGVGYAGSWSKEPLRFCEVESAFVSRPLPPRGPRRDRRG